MTATMPAPAGLDPEVGRPMRPIIDYRAHLYPKVSRMLYNPGDEPIEFSVGGETMVIPARDTFAPKAAWGLAAVTNANGQVVRPEQPYEGSRALPGVLPMKDRYLIKKVQGTMGNVIYEVMPASEQCTMTCVLGPDGISGEVARRGVRLLSDDPDENELIMEDARTAWEEAMALADISIITAHEQINRKRAETNTPLVPPTQRVSRAYQRKIRREAEGRLARLFECPTCGLQNATEEARNSHIVVTHPEHARAMGVGQNTTFDLEGNERVVNMADRYQRGVTGAVAGHKVVVTDQAGNVISTRWEGETPLEAEARMNRAAMANDSPLRMQAVTDATGELVAGFQKQQAEMQARLDAMEELLAQRAAVEHASSQEVSGDAERKASLDEPGKGTKKARKNLAQKEE